MNKLKSRKFWMAAASAALIVANDGLGLNLPADSILGLTGIVTGYLVAQGVVDASGRQPAE